jgi:hypothetical protein
MMHTTQNPSLEKGSLMQDSSPSSRSLWQPVGWFALAACLIGGFHSLGGLYAHFHHAYGTGINRIPYGEQSFTLWMLAFGSLAWLCLWRGLSHTSSGSYLLQRGEMLSTRIRPALGVLMLLLLLAILSIKFTVLLNHVIADDELTLRFIAQTLAQGHLVNPPFPAEDMPFFANKFVLSTPHGWYGKYPIGHPLLLAFGELLHLRLLVVPLLTGFNLLLTFWVGRKLFSSTLALLACVLLVLSPQFVCSGATELSQVTSCTFMLLGMGGLLLFQEHRKGKWLLFAGLAFGWALLARPFPGVLFAPVAAWFVWFRIPEQSTVSKVKSLGLGAIGITLGLGVLLATNFAQTGHPLHTGYHQAHTKQVLAKQSKSGTLDLVRALGIIKGRADVTVSSLMSALVRQNIWLLGWPVSFLFLLFAARNRETWLLWSMLFAVYLYRVLVPKTVVATTGPVYVLEAVPLLVLATASGIHELTKWLEKWKVTRPRECVANIVLAGIILAGGMFWPVQWEQLSRTGRARDVPYQLLGQIKDKQALVFINRFQPRGTTNTWAYYPPNPSPKLDDKLLFVRWLPGRQGARRSIAFWKRRFPKRTAWIYYYRGKRPILHRITKAEDFPYRRTRIRRRR